MSSSAQGRVELGCNQEGELAVRVSTESGSDRIKGRIPNPALLKVRGFDPVVTALGTDTNDD